jgi:hypothetical protein
VDFGNLIEYLALFDDDEVPGLFIPADGAAMAAAKSSWTTSSDIGCEVYLRMLLRDRIASIAFIILFLLNLFYNFTILSTAADIKAPGCGPTCRRLSIEISF